MSVKLIAVDMDGTFLSDAKTYNRERFLAQFYCGPVRQPQLWRAEKLQH